MFVLLLLHLSFSYFQLLLNCLLQLFYQLPFFSYDDFKLKIKCIYWDSFESIYFTGNNVKKFLDLRICMQNNLKLSLKLKFESFLLEKCNELYYNKIIMKIKKIYFITLILNYIVNSNQKYFFKKDFLFKKN